MQGVEVPVWAGFAGLDVVRGADGDVPRARGQRADADRRSGSRRWRGSSSTGVLDPALPERRPAPGRAGAERFAAVLRAVAPGGRGDPSIVVLGDGFENDAQWEISDVAFRLGVPMVTLDDIQRARRAASTPASTGAGASRRRRSTGARTTTCCATRTARPSALAEKLLEPMRRGTVTVVNPPGVGIADDKLAHVYVEEMIRFYLGEEPVIAPARSYDLTDDERARGRARPAGASWSSRSATASAARAS